MSRAQYIFLVLLIGGMSALNPVAIDSFLPAIPDIAKELAVDPGTIGITIGIYTLGTALGQLFYGPLSDRFGLWLGFHPFSQATYLEVCEHWVSRIGGQQEWDEAARAEAVRFATLRGGRSGRTARQFAAH